MAPQRIIHIPADSPFLLANIPFGIFSTQSQPHPRPVLVLEGIFMDCKVMFPSNVLMHMTLNAFTALGRPTISGVRTYIQSLLSQSSSPIYSNPSLLKSCTIKQIEATMHLPLNIGDFTDFTSSKTHAKNMHSGHGHGGVDADMFHPPHTAPGHVSTILPSMGHLPTSASPESVPTKYFECMPAEKTEEHIFGVVLLNDWSARDIQIPESLPFGALNAKNFASTISPWVVTLDVLELFKIAHDIRRVPSYFVDEGDVTYDISVNMRVIPGGSVEREMGVARLCLRNSYWTFRQMDTTSLCSLVKQRKHFPNQMFLQDSDEVVFTAWCGSPQVGKHTGRVGFGECRRVVLPARL
ncbi:fumarylacetoacetase [Suillus cothurnatus]|nr:fumarylacetoacetase [Suillus cothurnatus]